MTWEELKQKAKEMGSNVEVFDEFIEVGYLYFWNDGEINMLGETVAKKRTPDQMYSIMKALQQEVDDG